MRWPSPPLPPVTSATAPFSSISLSSTQMDRRGGPIGGAAGQTVAGYLAVVIDWLRLLGECGTVVETVGVDGHGGARRALADRADINAAPLADQEFRGAGAKTVALDQRRVAGADLDRAVRIAGGARVVGATEGATASAQPGLGRRLRQSQADPKIAAVTAAPILAHLEASPREAITPVSAKAASSAAVKPASASTSAWCSPMRGG